MCIFLSTKANLQDDSRRWSTDIKILNFDLILSQVAAVQIHGTLPFFFFFCWL